jgi:hypothetical protein
MGMGWLASAALGLTACGAAGQFPCVEDVQCGGAESPGVCIEPGYCAFSDPDCASGLRFGAHAGKGFANTCVELETAHDTGSTAATDPLVESEATNGTVQWTTMTMTTTDSTGATVCPETWWDCGWSHRSQIDVTYSGHPVSNVPVYVALTDERIDFDVAASDGGDLRFVLRDEVLPHELVLWQPGGVTELWVRIPDLADVDDLFLYYGNLDATSAEDSAAVWSEGYFAVLHMLDEADTLGMLDLAAFGVEPAPGLLGKRKVGSSRPSRRRAIKLMRHCRLESISANQSSMRCALGPVGPTSRA